MHNKAFLPSHELGEDLYTSPPLNIRIYLKLCMYINFAIGNIVETVARRPFYSLLLARRRKKETESKSSDHRPTGRTIGPARSGHTVITSKLSELGYRIAVKVSIQMK